MSSARELTPQEAARWARVGMLSSLALVLGYLETFVPIPIPGLKLGLANIAILIALAQRDRSGAVAIGAIKVLASGLLFGNPLTMAYSAAGTALSLAVMLPLSGLPTLRLAMLSVAGAVAHETGQLLVAQFVLGTDLVWYSAPPLLVAAIVTGAVCGIVASRTVSLIGDDTPNDEAGIKPHPMPMVEPTAQDKASILAFLAFVVVVLRLSSPIALVACLAVALIACLARRMSPSDVMRAIRPVLPIAIITLVAQVATAQQGEALLTLGPVAITREAALRSVIMLCRLVSIAAASAAVARGMPRERGTGLARWALAPLSALGMSTEGPVLALDMAFTLVPALATNLEQTMSREGLRLTSPALWRDVIPGVVARLYTEAGASAADNLTGTEPETSGL